MNWTGILQQFARSLLYPTLVIPLAALLLWLGVFPWSKIGVEFLNDVFTHSGHIIFSQLPVLFAIGVALGLTKNSTLSGITAVIAFLIMVECLEFSLGTKVHLGVASGIYIGVLTAISYQLCAKLVLPEYFHFFGGSRLVPLPTILFTFISVYIGLKIIPFISIGMSYVSGYILEFSGWSTFIYGTIQRLLVPTGFHHLLSNFFLFQVGSYESSSNQLVFGDLTRYFTGDQQAGIFMGGLYPITLFALPAIAIAIIHESRVELKPKVKVTFITAALTCFLTGVTEPIEFAFLYVAPYLFLIHAILSGSAMWLSYELGIRHGFSYSAGAIDFIVNYHLAENALWLIPLGLFYGLLYYFLFRYAIRKFHLATPGREQSSILDTTTPSVLSRIPLIVEALGGRNNLIVIEACITRLRLTVADYRIVNARALQKLGAAGVIHLGDGNIQVVFGTYAEIIRNEIVRRYHEGNQLITFLSPVTGKMIPLEDVPDPVYANKIVGPGVAFLPQQGECLSPINGKVMYIYPSGHALGIETDEGVQLLIHIGIDSINFKGFSVFVKEGEHVLQGQLLVNYDLKQLSKLAKSTVTILIVTNPASVKNWNFSKFSAVKKGQSSVLSIELNELKRNGEESL